MHDVSSESQNDDMDLDEKFPSQEEFQELVRKNSELEELKRSISNELNNCSQEMNVYKEKLDEKEDQVKEISEKYKQSEENLKALQTIYDNKYLEIHDKNNNLTAQLENLSKKLIEAQKNDSTEISNLKTENERLDKVQTDYRKKNDELKAQLESLSAENESLKKAQIDYDNDYNSLGEQLSSLRKENKILRNGQKNLKDQNIKMKADYDDINDKLNTYLESDKLRNKKDPNYSVYKENADLRLQVKTLKKTHNSDKEKLTSRVTESDDKLEKILAENKLLKDKLSALSKIEDYSAIRTENDRLKDQLKQFEGKPEVRDKNGKISKLQNNSNELESIKQLQKKNEEYFKEINELNSLLQKREKEKSDLIEKNISLKKEASQYQSALGTITNYRMDDDDKNHSVQLKKDIEELQIKLKNYITTLKGDCEVDFDAVNGLMNKYSIKTKVTPNKPNKPLIKAVLQYHIIKKITKDFREYLKQNSKGSIMRLEAEIATKAKDLEDRLSYFSKTRSGTDTITQSASIKIRQEVNIALGNRGFSDIFYDGKDMPQEHVYIILETKELNKEMNKYRIIKDENKRNYVETLAPDLIREFIRIIHFRLKVQEPSAQVRWIKIDSNIDQSIMEGSWDKDDIDNLEVEVCCFPMIGRDLDDAENRKIYTNAQVFTRRKKFYSKGISYLTSKKAKVYLEPESDDDSHNGVE